jgi:dUTP pyrophosphatase
MLNKGKIMDQILSSRIKSWANAFEKFVEHNLMEKEHREENIKKLALAFENFKETSLRSVPSKNSTRVSTSSLIKIQVRKLEHFKGDLPKYQSEGASGLDVRAQLESSIEILPGSRTLIPTGLAMAIPVGYEIQVRPRSGLAMRDGVSVLNTPGTVDADYRGEIKIILINLGEKPFVVNDQDRIAQLVLAPVVQAQLEEVEVLSDTDRGAGGFGSTGRA